MRGAGSNSEENTVAGHKQGEEPKVQLVPENVTSASRTMLPSYPILALLFGFNYLTTETPHLVSASLTLKVTDRVMPLQVWGVLFLVVGAFQVVALIVGKRAVYEAALALMCGLTMFLALVFSAISVGLVGAAVMWVGFTAAGALILSGYRVIGYAVILTGGIVAVIYGSHHGVGSPTAFCWPLFVAVACWASIRSLTTRESTT